jgi:hypothetical protein
MRRCCLVLTVLLLATLPAAAKPLDPALQQQLLGLYTSYNQAVIAGNVQAALATRSAESRTAMQQQLKTPKDQQDFLEFARTAVPDRVEVRHATMNAAGDQATIVTLVSKTFPKDMKLPPGGPAPGSTATNELALHFVKNGANWSFDDQMWGPDPSKIVTCRDDKAEPSSAYDTSKQVEMGGPISRVDFQPDHTLVVVLVVDQETCVLLPNRDALAKQGVDVTQLVPYTIVSIDGLAHKTKKDKMLGQKLEIMPD